MADFVVHAAPLRYLNLLVLSIHPITRTSYPPNLIPPVYFEPFCAPLQSSRHGFHRPPDDSYRSGNSNGGDGRCLSSTTSEKAQPTAQRIKSRSNFACTALRSFGSPLYYAPAKKLAAERLLEPLVAMATASRPPVQPRIERETVTVQMASPSPSAPSETAWNADASLPAFTIDAALWERLISSLPAAESDFRRPIASRHPSIGCGCWVPPTRWRRPTT